MPKLSVIVPIYGVEKYLRECLDSIVNQTLKDIEIILVDDGGKDGCPAIIDEYAKKDSRIIAIHKENGGYGHTCNVGLERATGEYISIIEPDDYIDTNMFMYLHDEALRNNADIVKSAYIANYLGKEGARQVYSPNNKEFDVPKKVFTLKEYPQFMLIHPSVWSCIYKREFLNKNNIRFVEAPGAGWTDNPFQVQTMCLAERIFYVDKAFYYWRLFEWNDIRDFSLPFVRSIEIHNWLKENNITDENILGYLYKRELIYLRNVHQMLKFSNLQKYMEYLFEYLPTLLVEIIKDSKILKPREKRMFKMLFIFPIFSIVLEKILLLRQNSFRFKLTGDNQNITLFGFKLWGRIDA